MKFKSDIEIQAGVEAGGSTGDPGQILSSTGTGVAWIDQNAITSASDFVFFNVKNETGSTILKGKGVMAVGTDGNSGHILIDEMVANGTVEAKYFLGVLEENIANGGFARAISFGQLDQFNTTGQNGETWNDGQILWCDPANPGDFTITEPDGPNVKIAAAFILNSSTNGKIQIRVQANEGVHDLHDTKITSQVDGDVLVWDNTTGVWFNDSTLNVDYTNGRVGIGTTSPADTLQIDAANSQLRLRDTDDGKFAQFSYSGGKLVVRNNSTTTTVNQFTLDATGQLGIGTISPTEKLEVAGNVILDSANARLKIKGGTSGTNSGIDWTFNTDSTVYAKIELDYDTRASTGLLIDSGYPMTLDYSSGSFSVKKNGSSELTILNGNVGIGTDNPDNKLSVAGNIQATNNGVDISDNSDWPTNIIIGNSVYPAYIKAHRYTGSYSNGLDFYYSDASSGNSTLGIRLNSNGNVGIGTTSPATKLDVDGVITATGGNSTQWNTAYTDRNRWDGGATGLIASTGRASLGLGTLATLNSVNAATITDNSVGAAELNVSGDGTTAQYLRSDGDGTFTWATPTNTTYGVATDTVLGLVELFSNTDQTVAANAVTTTAGRTYGLQLNSANQGVINVPWTDTNTTYTAGVGLTLAGTEFSHADTSSQASVNNTGRTFIQDITLDDFGHVTGLVSATDADTFTGTVTSVAASAGTGISVSGSPITTSGTITITNTAPDTGVPAILSNGSVPSLNTGITAAEVRSLIGAGTSSTTGTVTSVATGGGLTGGTITTSGTISHADTSSQASVDNSNGIVIQDVTLDTYGHVTGLASVNLDGRYYTETESDSRFVNVTGDTMTGPLTIDTGSSTNALVIKGTSPTISLLDDSGEDDFYIHVNSNNFYVLVNRDANDLVGTGYESPHPLQLEGDTNIGYLFDSRIFADNYHPNADAWTTARTITIGNTGKSVSGSANVSWTLAEIGATNEAYVDLEIATRTPLNDIRSLGTNAFTNGTDPNITTAQVMAEIEGDGGFDSYSSVFKTSWSYAGNYNLTDAGNFTETAGSSWITWTDNSSDTTRGNITALAIAPNTGASAGGVFIYNDQGSGYSPGWRQVWTSTTDGSGSGLDADLLDGQHASAFQPAGNYFTDGDAVLNMGNDDGLVYNDTNNLMYIKADGTNYQIIDVRGGTMSGTLNMNGQTLNMANGNITAINNLTFNDPGPNEGIEWNGGNGWKIYESPDNLTTNSGGSLQFVTGSTRRMTIDTSGNVFALGSSRAPIFYDSNDTGYYLNPASTSTVNKVNYINNSIPIVVKLNSVHKSWAHHVSASDDYVLVPSGTDGGEDWAWSSGFNFNSTGNITANNFILRSDERLKTKITDLPCDNIDAAWKSFELKSDKGNYRTGVIAQELEIKHPEFVNTDNEGFKSVKYIDLLIAKIAELEARLEKAGI